MATPAQKHVITYMYKRGETHESMIEATGLPYYTIVQIITTFLRKYPHERRPLSINVRKGEDAVKAKLTAAQVLEIIERASIGEDIKHMADQYGISWRNIYYILDGRSWTNDPKINEARERYKSI